MRSWRYLADGSAGAADGLATDEAILLRYGARGAARDVEAGTLRLYSYRPHCALIGRYQNPEDEIDLGFCAERGIEISRRPTGGGAILMGPGQLGVAVGMRARGDASPRQRLRRFADGVRAGLARVGIAAELHGKNDLTVGGRKIAGLGLYLDPHGAVLFHASVLLDLDVSFMLRVLRIAGAPPAAEGARRIAGRLTTVSRELRRSWTVDAVREAFRDGFAGAFGAHLLPGTLDALELRRRDALVRERYGSEAWIHRRGPQGASRGSARLRTPHGLLRLDVGLHGTVIKSAMFSGDFNVAPPALLQLEGALRWCRGERAALESLALRLVGENDLGVGPAHIADLLWRAVRDARPAAGPRRLSGSCYAPDTLGVVRDAEELR